MSLPNPFKGMTSKQRAINAYNRGLDAKYKGDWEISLAENQRADKLRPGDEATLWNIAIAATALHLWDEARRAWKACGIDVNDGPGEVMMQEQTACVRLNPDDQGEVVWGTRIDPVRMRIENVPLAASSHCYGDIVLHDGAPQGGRKWNGTEYPVFNELHVWRRSRHSTFSAYLLLPERSSLESLLEACTARNIGIEDWKTVRNLCAKCSLGTPEQHECAQHPMREDHFGFGAESEEILRGVLTHWAETQDGVSYSGLRSELIALPAQPA